MNIRAILSIAWSDTLHLLRIRSVVFWIIVFPIILVLLSAFIWFNPSPTTTYSVGIVDLDKGNGTQWLLQAFSYAKVDNKSLFKIIEYNNTSQALNDLLEDKVDIVLVVPEGFTSNLTRGFSTRLEAYVSAKNPTKSMIVKSVISSFINEFSKHVIEKKVEVMMHYALSYINATMGLNETVGKYVRLWFKSIVNPVNLTVEEVSPKERRIDRSALLAWAVVGIIAVESLFVGLIRGATVITEERERQTLYRLLASPISGWELLVGKTIGVLVAVGISAIPSVSLGVLLGARILFNPLSIDSWIAVAMIIIATLFFTGLGLIISMFAKSEAGATALANALAFTLMFTSGVWWPPKEWLPEPLKTIAYHNPATLAVDAARNILAYGMSIGELSQYIPLIGLGTIIVYATGAIVYKKLMSKLIE